MSSDGKILKTLEDLKEGQKALNSKVDTLEHGQKALQADVTAMKGEVEKIPAIEKQLEQQGKMLNAVMANTATLLEEHAAQRIDIRSLHTDMQSLHSEVHASKEEVKAEIRAARADAKRDNIDLKATVGKQFKGHEERIDALEDDAGIPHPDKN